MAFGTLARLGLAALLAAAGAVQAQAVDVEPFLSRAGTAAKAGKSAAAIDALEQALEKLRAAAPMEIKPFVLVKRPAKFFGDYDARGNNVFRRGEPMQFYMEPKNLVYPRSGAGTYTPAFEVDMEVLTADGKVLGKQDKFGALRLPSRSAVQDIFMNLKLTLSGAPAGAYQVRFVVRDANSQKRATVTQPITVK
jgi:hypothetical protein